MMKGLNIVSIYFFKINNYHNNIKECINIVLCKTDKVRRKYSIITYKSCFFIFLFEICSLLYYRQLIAMDNFQKVILRSHQIGCFMCESQHTRMNIALSYFCKYVTLIIKYNIISELNLQNGFM